MAFLRIGKWIFFRFRTGARIALGRPFFIARSRSISQVADCLQVIPQ